MRPGPGNVHCFVVDGTFYHSNRKCAHCFQCSDVNVGFIRVLLLRVVGLASLPIKLSSRALYLSYRAFAAMLPKLNLSCRGDGTAYPSTLIERLFRAVSGPDWTTVLTALVSGTRQASILVFPLKNHNVVLDLLP